MPDAFLARVRCTEMAEYPNVSLAVASRGGPVSACHRVFHFIMELLTPSQDTINTGTFGERRGSRTVTGCHSQSHRPGVFRIAGCLQKQEIYVLG